MDYSDLNTKFSYLLKQLFDKGFINKNKLLKTNRITVEELEMLIGGNWYDPQAYIVCYSFAIARMVPRKFKLKKIPNGLPSREEIEAMMNGTNGNVLDYYKFIYVLNRTPNKLLTARIVKNVKDDSKHTKPRNHCKSSKSTKRRGTYGENSQVTRKAWGSAYKPARG